MNKELKAKAPIDVVLDVLRSNSKAYTYTDLLNCCGMQQCVGIPSPEVIAQQQDVGFILDRGNYLFWSKNHELQATGQLRIVASGAGFVNFQNASESFPKSAKMTSFHTRNFLHEDVVECVIAPSSIESLWMVVGAKRVNVRGSFVARVVHRRDGDYEAFPLDSKIRNIKFESHGQPLFSRYDLVCITPEMNESGELKVKCLDLGRFDDIQSWHKAALIESNWAKSAVIEFDEQPLLTQSCDHPFISIDGALTVDRDDAIYAEKTECGYRIYVAITDVDLYVTKNSEIDEYAKNRSTSLYLMFKFDPMLPNESLRKQMSLDVGQVRQCIVFTIDYGADGEIINSSFSLERAKVHANLNYDEVDKYLSEGTPLEDPVCENVINTLREVYAKRRSWIEGRKPHQIDFMMTKSEIDENGDIVNFHTSLNEMSLANLLVQMCMVDVGEYAGTQLTAQHGIFRTQAGPDEYSLTEMRKVLYEYASQSNWELEGNETLDELIDLFNEKSETAQFPEYIRVYTQRINGHSRYTTTPEHHYSMGLLRYAQCTSPMRRYVDLMNIRGLKSILSRSEPPSAVDYTTACELANLNEMRSGIANRTMMSLAVTSWLNKQCAQGSVELPVEVVSISPAVLHVRFEGTSIDWWFPLFRIPSKPQFDRNNLRLNFGNGASVSVGDIVNVKVDTQSSLITPCQLVDPQPRTFRSIA